MIYYFYVVFSFVIWSSYGILIKIFKLNPFSLILYLSIFGSFFIFLYIKKKKIKFKLNLRIFILILLASVLLFGNTITYFYAFKYTSITNTILSHYLAPVIAAIFIPIFLNEKIDKITVISLVISLLGLFLIFFPKGTFTLNRNDFIGIIFGLFSAFCYAFLIIIAKYIISSIKSLILMFYENLISVGIIFLLFPFIRNQLMVTKYVLILYIILGFTHNFIAPLLYLEGLKRIKAQHVAILGYVEPVSAILMEILILNYMPAIGTIIGGFLILFSGFIIIKWSNKLQ